MERTRYAPHHDSLVCTTPAVAIWYGEQVAPVSASEPLPPLSGRSQTALQNDPVHEPNNTQQPKYHDTTAQFLAKIRAPYDAHEKHLKWIGKQLKQPTEADSSRSGEFQTDRDALETLTYATALSIVCFAELVERTRKYAAFALLHTYRVHPVDVDDGLQAGYLRLWERLQQEPEILKDKSLAWIGKGIVYSALHAIRSDWVYRQHAQAETGEGAKGGWGTHASESRQADIRTDVHQAIASVANHILTHEKGKKADHDLWALYGLTMLQVSSSELSRLFHVREQSMHLAYNRVREWLKAALPHYTPVGETKRVRQHGPEALPRQDMTTIRQANADISEATYTAVQTRIAATNADTRRSDEIALEGIRKGIPISTHARKHDVPQYQMQRAYKRVHLMLAAEHDPSVRTLRPERRMKSVFTLTAESAAAVEQLASDFLTQPKSYEKLVALHAHIGNLAISTTAKHFNIPISTLRYYSQQIGKHLKTPLRPAREKVEGKRNRDEPLQREGTVYSNESAAD